MFLMFPVITDSGQNDIAERFHSLYIFFIFYLTDRIFSRIIHFKFQDYCGDTSFSGNKKIVSVPFPTLFFTLYPIIFPRIEIAERDHT